MSIWGQYPVLERGNEVHLTPRGGTLFADDVPYTLSLEQADFLAAADGTHPLGELMPGEWSEPYGDYKFARLVTRLVDEARLTLKATPASHPVRVTGSRGAFIPPHMSIELTIGCNLRCRHCYRESEPEKNAYMPTEDLLDVLDRLHQAGLRSVELTGGEPLMHRDFPAVLDFCSERFPLVGVLTNGTLLPDAVADRFSRMGDQLLLSMSLDGPNPESHDLRRGVPGSFAKTTRHLARLSDMGVNVRVSMCVDEGNFADIESTLLLARELGAKAFSYTPVLPLGRGKTWAPPGWNLDGREVLQAEQEIAERHKGFLATLPAETLCGLEGNKGCGAGHRTYAMDPWANVRPCATWGADELIIGNLRQQSIEEVFGHPVTRALEEIPVPSHHHCAGCEMELFCRYCPLRGLHGERLVENCAWGQLPAVEAVKKHWQAPAEGLAP